MKFYRYTKGFMHQKVILIDDFVSAIGTANFDNRSFRLNFELTSLIADPDFNAKVERMLQEDFRNARIMELDELDEKSFWSMLMVRLARLSAPIL